MFARFCTTKEHYMTKPLRFGDGILRNSQPRDLRRRHRYNTCHVWIMLFPPDLIVCKESYSVRGVFCMAECRAQFVPTFSRRHSIPVWIQPQPLPVLIRISARNFLPEHCGEIQPEPALLQALTVLHNQALLEGRRGEKGVRGKKRRRGGQGRGREERKGHTG